MESNIFLFDAKSYFIMIQVIYAHFLLPNRKNIFADSRLPPNRHMLLGRWALDHLEGMVFIGLSLSIIAVSAGLHTDM